MRKLEISMDLRNRVMKDYVVYFDQPVTVVVNNQSIKTVQTTKKSSMIFECMVPETSCEIYLMYSYNKLFKTHLGSDSVYLPSGKDVYTMFWDCNGRKATLTLKESYADKQWALEQQRKKEQEERNRIFQKKIADTNQLIQKCVHEMDEFKRKTEQFFGSSVYLDQYEYIKSIHSNLSKVDEYKKIMPLPDRFACEWESYYQTLKKQEEKFEDYIYQYFDMVHKATLFSDDYGQVNEQVLKRVQKIRKKDADEVVSKFYMHYQNHEWDQFSEMNVNDVLYYLWFYAMNKPFDADYFYKTRILFDIVYKTNCNEPVLAQCFATIQVSGITGISDLIRNRLRNYFVGLSGEMIEVYKKQLHSLASGLMWMKAYQQEKEVLEYMMQQMIPMTAKEQERLHLLSTSNGKNVEMHEVNKSAYFTFVVDSLEWKDKEYQAFFEHLAFQDRKLDYSLALRDERKDLVLAHAVSIPDLDEIEQRVQAAFDEEYGGDAEIHRSAVKIVANGENEILDGFLAESNDLSGFGIFVYLVKVGKKINIKFYTLYLPENVNASIQCKKALSFSKQINPTVSMWETSLKETILLGIQRIFNEKNTTVKQGTGISGVVEF